MKKLIALLTVLLLLTTVASCEETQFRMSGFDGESGNHDWNNNLFFNRMEEMTNVSFHFNQFNDKKQWEA